MSESLPEAESWKKLDKKRLKVYIDTKCIASAQLVHFQLSQARRTTNNRFGMHTGRFLEHDSKKIRIAWYAAESSSSSLRTQDLSVSELNNIVI